MADTIAGARRRRGTVRARLTRTEKDVGKLEEKVVREGSTPADLRKIKRLKELAKEHDRDYEERHVEVLNYIEAEDTAALDAEEKIFDEHVNRVSEIIERLGELEDLVATTESLRPPASKDREVTSEMMKNDKRLRHLKDSMDKAIAKVRTLEPTPDLDVCLVEKLKKDVDALTKRLSDIVEDVLSLPRMVLRC